VQSYNKGDLVLVSNNTQTSTCIILTEKYAVSSEKNYNFYYTYCLETGLYGLIYESEITALVAPEFAPEFEFHSELFDTDYEIYSELYERFTYFPSFYPNNFFDMDTEDDDEDDE